MRRFVRIAVLPAITLSLILTTFGSLAAAQGAGELRSQGEAALAAGNYSEAVRALDASYRAEQVPMVLYNLARGYEGLGYPDKALQAYESYAQYADAKAEAAAVAAAKQRIAELKGGHARFALKLTPPDATIEIDGKPATTKGGELWVDTGRRKITIRASGYETYEQVLDVSPGRFDLEVQLRVPSEPPPVRAAALVDEGIALQAGGDAAGAIAKFEEAESIFSTPRGQGQLGLAQEQVGDLGHAESNLADALDDSRDPYVKENRKKLRRALRRIRKQIGELTISGSPAGAEVFVNGISIGLLPFSQPVMVKAGNLTITAKKEGYDPFEQLLDLPARGKRQVVVSMTESPVVAPVVAPVVTPAPTPTPAEPPAAAAVQPLTQEPERPARVESLDTQPPAEPPPPAEQQAPSQADIEAFSDPRDDLDEPTDPKESATGFESSINFGYQALVGGPKTQGSSGMLVPQITLGARIIWPLSFGIQINGGFDLGVPGTSAVVAANPGLYLRGHVQQEKRDLWFDVWGGVGLQPIAMQVVVLDAKEFDTSEIDINSLDESARSDIARQQAGVDSVRTVQSLNIPIELGATFWITKGFGIDLATALTFWLPTQDCKHDGDDTLCFEDGLKSQTTFFIGGGVAFLP